jgi:transcriptional regulator with GAF, ATPase, and Fis domain
MQAVCATVIRVACSRSTVLLVGESGVGKDLIAHAIHFHSLRRDRPFVKINCSALPENLMESELFGYEKGAFTGATASKPGKFEQADTGTAFLDEIGDVPPAVQVKLLRVLQEREFERLGSNKTLHIDVRIIAATNQDLRAALEQGTFREDLYYRLNVVPINLPPLRERPEDIPFLAEHFVRKLAGQSGSRVQSITDEAIRKLMGYHWPGNVRELENVIERSLVLCTSDRLDAADIRLDIAPCARRESAGVLVLPDGMTLDDYEEVSIRAQPVLVREPEAVGAAVPACPGVVSLYDAERDAILQALRFTQGNRGLAARLLGIGRTTMYRKLRNYNNRLKGDARLSVERLDPLGHTRMSVSLLKLGNLSAAIDTAKPLFRKQQSTGHPA